jgi:hypothetical protein
MTVYRIHRLREHLKQPFRNATHVSGTAQVKPRDYLPASAETVEAASPYAAYFALKDSETALVPGDLLEAGEGNLFIYKFVGFEPAQWVMPEAKPQLNLTPVEVLEPMQSA